MGPAGDSLGRRVMLIGILVDNARLNGLNKRLDDLSERLDDFRAHMDARFSAMDALLTECLSR